MPALAREEDAAQEWADQYNAEAQQRIPISIEASWNYNTNITDHNSQVDVSISSMGSLVLIVSKY